MGIFVTLFELAKLPLIVAKDTLTAIPDASMLKTPFRDTRRQCEKIDEEMDK